MITRYECELDGVPLSLLDERIFVTDISEMETDEQLTVTPYAVRMGSRRVRKKRDSLSVVVSFVIGTQDVEERKRICQKAQEWARKGRYLTINDRAWQRLRAVCEVLPRLSSSQNWQEVLQMEFVAYELPYWEAVVPVSLTTVGSGELFVPGMWMQPVQEHPADKMDKQSMEKWVKHMRDDKDMPIKPWTVEEVKPLAMRFGYPTSGEKFDEFYTAIHMMKSDYCAVAEDFDVNTPAFYAALADAWLKDPDAAIQGREKLEAYHKYIVMGKK